MLVGLLFFALILGAVFASELFLEWTIGLGLLGSIVALATFNWPMLGAGLLMLGLGVLGEWVRESLR